MCDASVVPENVEAGLLCEESGNVGWNFGQVAEVESKA